MSDERDGAASAVILSFLLGGLTGAVVALLYAPRSGRETRDILAERMREGAERGREVKDQVIAKGREVVDEAAGYVEQQREALDRRRERLSAAVEAGRQAFREEKEKA